MSTGFRKSLFGFNCDDVMSYIEKAHKRYSEKETELSEKISELENSVKTLTEKTDALTAQNTTLKEELKVYTDKADEIERMSENIGKLYLVSQANAKSILDNAQRSRQIAREEVAENLAAIDEAHRMLNEVKTAVSNTSNEFESTVSSLTDKLLTAKSGIAAADSDSAEKALECENLVSELSNNY